jgi:uncharacterized protein (TIGR01777 family)
MRVIITGGSGLIGSALAESLAADGHEVVILSRNPARAAQAVRMQKGMRAEAWDGRTAQGWAPLAEGAGAIVNLAGESIAGANPVAGRWTAGRKQAMRESSVNAGRAVVEAVRAAREKPAVVVQASAVGYYGPRGDEVVTEATPPGDDFLAKLCLEWEASTQPVESLGVRRAIARTGLPLSLRGGLFPPLRTVFGLFVGGPLGSGKHYWPWIHMADEVAALRFLIESGAAGLFNLCAPNPVTNREFSRALARVMGRPAVLGAPAFALRLALGELADELMLSGQRQAPEKLQQMGFVFKFPTLEPALRDLLHR